MDAGLGIGKVMFFLPVMIEVERGSTIGLVCMDWNERAFPFIGGMGASPCPNGPATGWMACGWMVGRAPLSNANAKEYHSLGHLSVRIFMLKSCICGTVLDDEDAGPRLHPGFFGGRVDRIYSSAPIARLQPGGLHDRFLAL
jgi:hypothetical protein